MSINDRMEFYRRSPATRSTDSRWEMILADLYAGRIGLVDGRVERAENEANAQVARVPFQVALRILDSDAIAPVQ